MPDIFDNRKNVGKAFKLITILCSSTESINLLPLPAYSCRVAGVVVPISNSNWTKHSETLIFFFCLFFLQIIVSI